MAKDERSLLADVIKASGRLAKADLPAPSRADLRKQVDAAIGEATEIVKKRKDLSARMENMKKAVRDHVAERKRLQDDEKRLKDSFGALAKLATGSSDMQWKLGTKALAAIDAAGAGAKSKDPALADLVHAIRDLRMAFVDFSPFDHEGLHEQLIVEFLGPIKIEQDGRWSQ